MGNCVGRSSGKQTHTSVAPEKSTNSKWMFMDSFLLNFSIQRPCLDPVIKDGEDAMDRETAKRPEPQISNGE